MMRKFNNRAFTVVEVVVTIAIIGIILIIALPRISSMKDDNKLKKFDAYRESFLSAAKLYVDTNGKDMFGNHSSGCLQVTYDQLENSNLIKKFGEKNVTCKNAKTYVNVRKANSHYFYDISIICTEEDDTSNVLYDQVLESTSKCEFKEDKDAPKVEIVGSDKNVWKMRKDTLVKVKVEDDFGLNKNIEIEYWWEEVNTHKIVGPYQYNYHNKEGVKKVNYDIPLKSVPEVTGKYRFYVKSVEDSSGIMDIMGNKYYLTDNDGVFWIDNTPPKCVTTGGGDKWFHEAVTLYGTCSDSHSGCVSNVSKKFDAEVMNELKSPGSVKDKAGNVTVCPSNRVKIDKKPNKPTISNPTNGNWVNYNFSLKVKTTTKKERIGYWQYSYDQKSWTTYKNSATNNFTTTPFSAERNQLVYIRVCTNASGICSDSASTRIRIDKTKPTFKFSMSGIKTAVVTCSDSASGISGTSKFTVALTGSGNRNVSKSCKDKAGNTGTGSHTYRYSTCASGENTCKYGCSYRWDSCYYGSPNACQGGYVKQHYSCCKYWGTQWKWRYTDAGGFRFCWGAKNVGCMSDYGGLSKAVRLNVTRQVCTGYGQCSYSVWSNCAYRKNTCQGKNVPYNCSNCYTGHNTCKAGWVL